MVLNKTSQTQDKLNTPRYDNRGGALSTDVDRTNSCSVREITLTLFYLQICLTNKTETVLFS